MSARAGDLVFLTTTCWSSRFIRWITGGRFSHVAVYVSSELILESDWNGVQLSKFGKYKDKGVTYEVLPLPLRVDRKKFLKSLLRKIGDGYDYSLFIGNGLYRLFEFLKPYIGYTDSEHRYICIEYVIESLKDAGEVFMGNTKTWDPDYLYNLYSAGAK
jgi:hypothetical protein